MARRWRLDTLADQAEMHGWKVWHKSRFAFIAYADPRWERSVLVSWPDGKRQKTARIRENAEALKGGKSSAAKVAAYMAEHPGVYPRKTDGQLLAAETA